MKFIITDGRPWYKQVVSGIIYAACIAFAIPLIATACVIAAVVIGVLYYKVQEVGLSNALGDAGKFILNLICVVVSGVILVVLHEWSTRKPDDQ